MLDQTILKQKIIKLLSQESFDGNYIHYGVREHAMCGIMNGLALHSKLVPYGGTFLIFQIIVNHQ